MNNGSQKFYNILSIDGGGIRGIIPIQVVKYLEDETYKYALEKGYIEPKPEGVEKKLYMPQFFDHLAGTSIGGIISLLLTVPSDPAAPDVANPKFSSTKAMELLGTKGAQVFQVDEMLVGHRIFLVAISTIFGACIWLAIGKICFRNKAIEQRAEELEQYMINKKLEIGADKDFLNDSDEKKDNATPAPEDGPTTNE